MANNTTSQDGKDLIIGDEGLRLQAYLDTSGVPTIAVGEIYINGRRVVMGDTITKEMAETMFDADLAQRERQLNELVTADLNDNQYAGLMDWFWEFGYGNAKASTLIRLINQSPKDNVAPEFLKQVSDWLNSCIRVIGDAELFAKQVNTFSAWVSVNCPENSISYQFLRWVHGGHGEMVPGIFIRRAKDILLYNKI
jgi:lysozyme